MEIGVPLINAIVKSRQTILRVGNIGYNQGEYVELGRDRATFLPMLHTLAKVELDIEWFDLGEDCSARVPILRRATVPVLDVAGWEACVEKLRVDFVHTCL